MAYGKKKVEREERAAKRLADMVSQLTGNLGHASPKIADFAKAMGKALIASESHTEALESRIKIDKSLNHRSNNLLKMKDEEVKKEYVKRAGMIQSLNIQKQMKVIDEQTKRARNSNRIEVEKEHGAQVRHNTRLRNLFKDQSQSFSNVMNLMTGMSKGKIVGGGMAGIAGALQKSSEVGDLNKKLVDVRAELSGQMGSRNPDQDKIKELKSRIDRIVEHRGEVRDRMGIFKGMAGEDDNDGALGKLNPLVDWAKRNKTGIIISAASIGLLFMTFKKLLSVSPMLQKMLEVMNIAFNLVLRPFGDFLGFVLRPLAMMFLATAMPFFKTAYPFLMKLGMILGKQLAAGDILGMFFTITDKIKIEDVMKYLFDKVTGNSESGLVDEENVGGSVGAIGGVLGAGAIGGTYGAYKVGKWGMGKVGGMLGMGGKAAKAAAAAANAGTGAPFGGMGNTANNASKLSKVQKAAAKAAATAAARASATKAALLTAAKAAKVGIGALRVGALAAKLSNPIGWAVLGWEGVTSAIKHFSPETYQQMRDATEFMGVGREFIGLGEQSGAEMLVGGYEWAKDKVGVNNSIQGGSVGDGSTIPTDPNHNPNDVMKNIQIVFNIDKIEKGIDINMIAQQVASVLETATTRSID